MVGGVGRDLPTEDRPGGIAVVGLVEDERALWQCQPDEAQEHRADEDHDEDPGRGHGSERGPDPSSQGECRGADPLQRKDEGSEQDDHGQVPGDDDRGDPPVEVVDEVEVPAREVGQGEEQRCDQGAASNQPSSSTDEHNDRRQPDDVLGRQDLAERNIGDDRRGGRLDQPTAIGRSPGEPGPDADQCGQLQAGEYDCQRRSGNGRNEVL